MQHVHFGHLWCKSYGLSLNRKVSSVGQSVEITTGHLKGSFRRLRELYCMKIADCCYLVTSACVLQNLSVLKKDNMDDYLEQNPNQVNRVNPYSYIYRNDQRGMKKNYLVQSRIIIACDMFISAIINCFNCYF